jgi:uncharacterized membrane protein
VRPYLEGLLQPIITERGLITIPGTVALLIWAASGVTIGLDNSGFVPLMRIPGLNSWLTDQTAIAVLSTIAGAAITTLSLVYSLVLVVFTLAAGTIAPRLLKRFRQNRVSQITAGLLGGTFLYSLTVLSVTGPNEIQLLSTVTAFLLAALSVLQLIYFVHSVSVSVMIDEEIASISQTLCRKMLKIVRTGETAKRAGEEMPSGFKTGIASKQSGFLSSIDASALVKLAKDKDITIKLSAAPGDFVAEEAELARISTGGADLDADQLDRLRDSICKRLTITRAREDLDDVVFSLNLLLEIALRALSPGINDTFTAIACVNHLAEALGEPVAKGIARNVHLDESDTPRLEIPGLTLEDLLKKSIQPLRLAAASNHLVLVSLADLIRRLYAHANSDKTREMLARHASELLQSYAKTDPLESDFDDLRSNLAHIAKS